MSLSNQHSLETQVMTHLYQTVAIHWWRAVKHFGRINIKDLVEGTEMYNRADLEILKQSGVVSFETTSTETYIVDKQRPAVMSLYLSLMNMLPEEDRPKTLTENEYKLYESINAAGSLSHLECMRFCVAATATLQDLMTKRLLVVEDDEYVPRFSGREKDKAYDLERTERIYLFQHNARWGARK